MVLSGCRASFEVDPSRAYFLREYSLNRLPDDPDLRHRAAEFLRKQVNEKMGNDVSAQQRVFILDSLGDVLVAQGENRDALDVYQQSLTIFRLLAKQDKSNAGWQREL